MEPENGKIEHLSALGLAGTGVDVEQRQALRMRLDLYDESIVMTRFEHGHVAQCYEVSPDALAASMAGLPIVSGLLPRNCLFCDLGAQPRLGIYRPPQVRTVKLYHEGEVVDMRVPFPPAVFVGQGRTYRIFAVRRYPAAGREPLYYFPAPNIWRDGRVCQGDVPFPACTVETICEAAEMFFASQFNHDLEDGKSKKYEESIIAMWRDPVVVGADEYPLEDLRHSNLALRHLWEA
jgi:PRTRC genetic system protein B